MGPPTTMTAHIFLFFTRQSHLLQGVNRLLLTITSSIVANLRHGLRLRAWAYHADSAPAATQPNRLAMCETVRFLLYRLLKTRHVTASKCFDFIVCRFSKASRSGRGTFAACVRSCGDHGSFHRLQRFLPSGPSRGRPTPLVSCWDVRGGVAPPRRDLRQLPQQQPVQAGPASYL